MAGPVVRPWDQRRPERRWSGWWWIVWVWRAWRRQPRQDCCLRRPARHLTRAWFHFSFQISITHLTNSSVDPFRPDSIRAKLIPDRSGFQFSFKVCKCDIDCLRRRGGRGRAQPTWVRWTLTTKSCCRHSRCFAHLLRTCLMTSSVFLPWHFVKPADLNFPFFLQSP